MIGPGLSVTQTPVRAILASVAVEPPLAPFDRIAPDGWRAQYSSVPQVPAQVQTYRPGYDANLQEVTVRDNIAVTTRVRKTYPDHAELTPDIAALSDYICDEDVIAGAVNDSTLSYPRPVANWSMPHRNVVADSLPVSLVAFHHYARGGKQVAGVRFIATDGTSTVTQIVNQTTANQRPGDRQHVVEYVANLDISGLSDGLITVNAEIYPHVGTNAAILKSAQSSIAREFSPRYFLKDATLAQTPPYAYISQSGNDATAIVSTNPAIAKQSPFASISGAWEGLRIARASQMQGAVIRVGSGTFVLSAAFNFYDQDIAAITIERDPDIAPDAATLTFGASAFRPRLRLPQAPLATTALRFRNIHILRTGTNFIRGESAAGLDIFFENVVFDNAGHNSSWHSSSHSWIFGMELLNPASSAVGASAHEFRILRGLRSASSGGVLSYEGWLILGSEIHNCGTLARGTRSYSGAIYAFNKFLECSSNSAVVGWGGSSDASGCAAVQNIFEFTDAVGGPSMRLSGDSASGNLSNIILHRNSFAGFDINGRGNLFYDDGPTPRTSQLISARGNIHVQVNCKGDIFTANGARTGNWAYRHGVGCCDEFAQFCAADGSLAGQATPFAQDYAGPGADYGTSNNIRNDPQYIDDMAFTERQAQEMATMQSQHPAPCKGSTTISVLSHDLAGNMRPVTGDSRGAYV